MSNDNIANAAPTSPAPRKEPKPAPKSLPVENIRQTKPKHLSHGPLPMRIANKIVKSFQGTGKRNPNQVAIDHSSDGCEAMTSGNHERGPLKKEHVRLITIGISHYCEKARWGLDLVEADPTSPLYYTEDAHPPGFAAFETVPASEGQASMTPMVVFDNNKHPALFESTEILEFFCPFLYPKRKKKEIEDFEQYLDEHLGPTVRCFAYNELLTPSKYDVLGNFATAHTSKVETVLFKQMLGNGLAKGMRKRMNITQEKADLSLSEIRSVFETVSDRLSDGRQYLFDDENDKLGFTAADLTFAALASPLVTPKELLQLQIDRRLIPANMCSVMDELKSTPAGQHAIKMYHHHRFGTNVRPRSDSNCALAFQQVVPKSVGRNRVPLVLSVAAAALVAGAIVKVRSKL